MSPTRRMAVVAFLCLERQHTRMLSSLSQKRREQSLPRTWYLRGSVLRMMKRVFDGSERVLSRLMVELSVCKQTLVRRTGILIWETALDSTVRRSVLPEPCETIGKGLTEKGETEGQSTAELQQIFKFFSHIAPATSYVLFSVSFFLSLTLMRSTTWEWFLLVTRSLLTLTR